MSAKLSNAADFESLNVQQQQFQNYSDSYSEFGIKLIDLPIETQLSKVVAGFLPNNYRGVDLGSNYGGFASQTQSICQSLGKKGTFYSVDPYPTNEKVLKMTSQQFVSNPSNSNMDVMLCKYSVHFNSDQPSFFSNAYNRLKDDGKFIIMQVGSNCQFPWSKKIESKFRQIYVKAADIIPSQLFSYEVECESKNIQLEKRFFREFIKRRSWSNLLMNTEQEIQECLQEIDDRVEKTLTLKTFIWKYTLTKKLNKKD